MKCIKFGFYLLLVILTSCANETYEEDSYDTLIIDGCEYLSLHGSVYQQSLSHKGNCKNPIHTDR